VLEDNAQCFLGTYKGRLAGKLGDAASYSFQSSKHITSGEGGMVITDDGELALEIRRVSGLGYAGLSAAEGKVTKRTSRTPTTRGTSPWLELPHAGALLAVALAQLERIDELVEKRIEAARLLDGVVKSCAWLVPQKVGAQYTHSYWTYVARIDRPDSDGGPFGTHSPPWAATASMQPGSSRTSSPCSAISRCGPRCLHLP